MGGRSVFAHSRQCLVKMIDLGRGHPQTSLLPLELMQKSLLTINNSFPEILPHSSLQYGHAKGHPTFRRVLSQFITRQLITPTLSPHPSPHSPTPSFHDPPFALKEIDEEDLITTYGVSNALVTICRFCTKSGDTIFVEEPTYFLALYIFRQFGLQLVGIKMEADGMNIDDLQQKLKQYKPVFLYTIPTFHNPTSTTLSHSKRDQLLYLFIVSCVQIASESGFAIVADEVYHFLSYSHPPPPPFMAYDLGSKSIVYSVGSFTKILGPDLGLRLGWIHTNHKPFHDWFTSQGEIIAGGGATPLLTHMIMNAMHDNSVDDFLVQIREIYKSRANLLYSSLQQFIPTLQCTPALGGYFLWAKLPPHSLPSSLLLSKSSGDISFQPGSKFSASFPPNFEDHVRLCFCFHEDEELVEGARRLGHLIESCAIK